MGRSHYQRRPTNTQRKHRHRIAPQIVTRRPTRAETTPPRTGSVPSRDVGQRWHPFKTLNLWRPSTWQIIKTYSSFKPFTRILLLLSLVAGVIVLIVCWTIDLGDSAWWHRHAYIPNIWAGFTGFLIGAPVALVILATFTAEREQNETLKRVNRLSQLAWDNFVSSAQKFCTPERMKAVAEGADEVKRRHDDAFDAVQNYITVIRGGRPGPYNPDELIDAVNAIEKSYEPFQTAVSSVTGALKDPETLAVEWSAIVGAWNTLDQYVRLQRLERNLAWFDPEIDAELRKWLSRPQSPLGQFAELHGFDIKHKTNVKTMVEAVDAVGVYIQLDEDARARALRASTSRFGYVKVRDYLAYAIDASFFLGRFPDCVNKVIDANWPASETKPKPIEK